MSNIIQIKVEELNALPATKIVENENVERKFIQMYNAIWGSQIGEQIYHREVFNFQKVIRENPSLAECTKMSLYGCFLDIAVNGLSLDNTSKPQCYLIPRNQRVKCSNDKSDKCLCLNVDKNNNPIPCAVYNICFPKDKHGEYYEKRAGVSVTGYGELTMRQRAGQIRYADNPVIVYEGDVFSISLDSGVKKITYSAAIPRRSNKVIGSFIRIVRCDGSEDYQWLLETDISRLAKFSAKNNSYYKNGQRVEGKANDLYYSNDGGVDPGFLENKTIKHAFDAYPKVRTGKFTVMATEQEEEDTIDYGFVSEDGLNEPIISDSSDSSVPFGEDRQIEAPISVSVDVSQEDESQGF